MPVLKLFYACLAPESKGNEVDNEPYYQGAPKTKFEALELEKCVPERYPERCKPEEVESKKDELNMVKTCTANRQKKLAAVSGKSAAVKRKPKNATENASNVSPAKPARRLIKLTRFFAKTVTNVVEELSSGDEEL